ncbi:MAG TPA: Txe/YoeB family addiction module toxin [Bacteroidetes bacterium]|nr:Txe/YoeB family addiction module toxin [Bacteroidota bacterium]
MSSFTLNEPQHPSHGQDANGLANAWLVRTLAVSFCSHSVWSKSKISLRIQNQQTVSNTVVIHTCSHKNIDTKLIQELQKVRRPPLRSRQEVDQWFPIAEGYFLSDKAKDDLIYWYEQNQHKTIEKINSFFKEIWESPFQGTGKVEPLSGDLSGWWSRRITDEHRLIYKVEGKKLFVCSCRGHYEALSCNT